MSKKIYIAVDVQNDFVSGILGSEWAQKVAPKIVDFVKMIRESDSDASIIATQDSHYLTSNEYNIAYEHTLEGEKLPVPHCIKDSEGWEFVPGLRDNLTASIWKETFMSDELPYTVGAIIDKNARRAGHQIDEIVLFGFCTSICVISNALNLRGRFPNMKITVLKNLCGDINEESHNAALKIMENCQIDVTDSRIFTHNKLSPLNESVTSLG
jgi:nicotinamidase-related amidase